MGVQTLTIARQKFAVVPFEDYKQLLKGIKPDDSGLPPLPKLLPGGNYPAHEFMRVSIARDIIRGITHRPPIGPCPIRHRPL